MHKISSFQINHNLLDKGFYLSSQNDDIFTYDLRFTKPNCGHYLSISTLHSIEHMMATALRGGKSGKSIVYFGPMGCRTGFYLLLRDIKIEKAKEIVKDAISQSLQYSSVPGSKRIECGNYRSHNLEKARTELKEYLTYL